MDDDLQFSSDFDWSSDDSDTNSSDDNVQRDSGDSESDDDSDNGEEIDGENDLDGGGLTPEQHLQTVFQMIDIEDVPAYDSWQTTPKVFCRPAFQPASPTGPKGVTGEGMNPVDFLNLFYDDEMLNKVCCVVICILYYIYLFIYVGYICRLSLLLF